MIMEVKNMNEHEIGTAILKKASWYKTQMSIPDFLRWIANNNSEAEIKALLENGVECGFSKFCQKMAYDDIMAVLNK